MLIKNKFAKSKVREAEEDGVINIDGVKLEAESTEVIFADAEKDIQVVVSPDPENPNSAVVAVITASEEDVEEETVLGSASVDASYDDAAEEAYKARRREAFKRRLESRAKSSVPAKSAREARFADRAAKLKARRESYTQAKSAREARLASTNRSPAKIAEACAASRAKFRAKAAGSKR